MLHKFHYLAVGLICFSLFGFIFHRMYWKDRMDCFNDLIAADHQSNCAGVIAMDHNKKGDPLSSGQIDRLIANYGICNTGAQRTMPTKFGEHPICGYHGNLIQASAFEHHARMPINQLERTKEFLSLSLYCACLGIPLILSFVYLIAFLKQRRTDKSSHRPNA